MNEKDPYVHVFKAFVLAALQDWRARHVQDPMFVLGCAATLAGAPILKFVLFAPR